ncbi:helix-turn-helix transcriptional regulator [Tsukamurella tyrosinosolvens]|uniref:helix-turn-helix transcriptional regulator n=1 Tax=Tsukamurella tyrosinosolvens TaxID=57704 RepID=UPI0007B2F1EF|nr:MerR family DNA-binding transcriptional regulator [Tsukamurella tyrosinosolvens]KZL97724.1 hypothetical protein AXX05_01915 [Tsukamurella tyrosinosolvens]RDB46831.1 DNA-binding protein [Tsukamurella tyrosinosolvens]
MSASVNEVDTAVDDPLLRAAQVAELCGTTAGTVRYWEHAGIGPRSFKLAGRRVWRRSAVLDWIAAQENVA